MIHVACAVEGAYDAHSAAMLHSVLTQAGGERVHVHYLRGPGFPSASLRRIEAMVGALGGDFAAHAIAAERVAGLPVVPEFTTAMWYRVFLPELLGDQGRVLYLDVDTLATDDLGPLWATDLGEHQIAAVTNVLMPHHRHRPAALGLAPAAYFNSGVLLMNLEAMRRERATEALVAFARERGAELEWPDQDTLNVVLGGSRLALHPRWNAMNSLGFPWAPDVLGAQAVAEARAAPAIRHFEGPGANKPWHRECLQDQRELYLAHRAETPWPRVRLEGSRLGALRRRLRQPTR